MSLAALGFFRLEGMRRLNSARVGKATLQLGWPVLNWGGLRCAGLRCCSLGWTKLGLGAVRSAGLG